MLPGFSTHRLLSSLRQVPPARPSCLASPHEDPEAQGYQGLFTLTQPVRGEWEFGPGLLGHSAPLPGLMLPGLGPQAALIQWTESSFTRSLVTMKKARL